MKSSNALQIMWPTTDASPLPIKSPHLPQQSNISPPTSPITLAFRHLFANAIYFWRIDFNDPNAHLMFCLIGKTSRHLDGENLPFVLGLETLEKRPKAWSKRKGILPWCFGKNNHIVDIKKMYIPEIKGVFEYKCICRSSNSESWGCWRNISHIQHGLPNVKPSSSKIEQKAEIDIEWYWDFGQSPTI